jgi:hypothetical protein
LIRIEAGKASLINQHNQLFPNSAPAIHRPIPTTGDNSGLASGQVFSDIRHARD